MSTKPVAVTRPNDRDLHWVARGGEAMEETSREPGMLIRLADRMIRSRFRMNSMRAGWQIAAVAPVR